MLPAVGFLRRFIQQKEEKKKLSVFFYPHRSLTDESNTRIISLYYSFRNEVREWQNKTKKKWWFKIDQLEQSKQYTVCLTYVMIKNYFFCSVFCIMFSFFFYLISLTFMFQDVSTWMLSTMFKKNNIKHLC